MELPYNPADKASIIAFAQRLRNITIREACDPEQLANILYKGKGNFGQTLEKGYFLYEPNSDSNPDFPEAGLELKSSPLKQIKDASFRAKERLVLNIINYHEIIHQSFNTSAFWTKNQYLLLVFYLHEQDVDILDLVIKLVDTWGFPDTDLAIIKKDWEAIQQKVLDGKAHELSEGDTFYLGACTKGANSASTRTQPNSGQPAMQRAYSLKQSYVNHIIATIAGDETGQYGKIIQSAAQIQTSSFEQFVLSKFQPFLGKTREEICTITKLAFNQGLKNFHAYLAKAILGVALGQKIEEFEKAGIIIKSVRLSASGMPREDVSFPNFDYQELVEDEWEDSQIKAVFERKFFFVFFQFDEHGQLFLREVKFWNMPTIDLEEAKRVWEQTRTIVQQGRIVREVTPTSRKTNFPNTTFSRVAHVRPHARNRQDTLPLPVTDQVTSDVAYTKHCFWLNKKYIKSNIFEQ